MNSASLRLRWITDFDFFLKELDSFGLCVCLLLLETPGFDHFDWIFLSKRKAVTKTSSRV